jgi:uncharacterized membrane protein required for colicin V production
MRAVGFVLALMRAVGFVLALMRAVGFVLALMRAVEFNAVYSIKSSIRESCLRCI